MQVILILSLCLSLVYAAVQLSPIDFNDQDWAAFVDCLQSGINNYDVTVEDGWINVGPVDPRDPDFDGLDALLQKCLIDISSRLMISGGYNVKSAQVHSVSSATSEWLRSLGAQSLESIPIDSILSNITSIRARSLDLDYTVRVSTQNKVCQNTNARTQATNECITRRSGFYKSIRLLNSTYCDTIRLYLWPHHKCPPTYNGGPSGKKSVFTQPGTHSACFASQRIYSYEATGLHALTCADHIS
jgi:hypothetical protein